MAFRPHLIVLALAVTALSAFVCATCVSAADARSVQPPMHAYLACTPNSGKVAGTNGIYYLRARSVGCKLARTVVRQYHSKRAATMKDSQTVESFACTAKYTPSYEGLQVSCRRPTGQSVGWTAYIIP